MTGTEEETRRGRKSKYDPLYHPDAAYTACATMGATNEQLWELFNITKMTFYNWQRKHPKFKKKIQKGKDEWDSQVVEKAYHRRALGYEYTEEEFEMVPIFDDDGNFVRRAKVKKSEKKKHQPADVKAQEGWLFCRQRERWAGLKDAKHTIEMEMSGELNQNHNGQEVPDALTGTAQILHILLQSGALNPGSLVGDSEEKSTVN